MTDYDRKQFEKWLGGSIGSLFVLVACLLLAINIHVAFTTKPTVGTVLSGEIANTNHVYQVKFLTVNQQEIITDVSLQSHGRDFLLGEQVELRYPTQDPLKAQKEDFGMFIRLVYPLLMLLMGAGSLYNAITTKL